MKTQIGISIICILSLIHFASSTFTTPGYNVIIMESNCNVTVNITNLYKNYGTIWLTNYYAYNVIHDCSLTLAAESNAHQIGLSVTRMNLYTTPNCSIEGVTIFDGEEMLDRLCGQISSEYYGQTFLTKTGKLTLHFSSNRSVNLGYDGFDMTFTSVRTVYPCEDNKMEYTCDPYECIPKILVCDKKRNCYNWTDEQYCNTLTTPVPTHVHNYIGLTILGVVLLCILVLTVIILTIRCAVHKCEKKNRQVSESNISRPRRHHDNSASVNTEQDGITDYGLSSAEFETCGLGLVEPPPYAADPPPYSLQDDLSPPSYEDAVQVTPPRQTCQLAVINVEGPSGT